MAKLKLHIKGLDATTAPRFEATCLGIEGVKSVDSWPGQAELRIEKGADQARIISRLRAAGFGASPAECQITTVAIEGMHCRACEITVERKFKSLPGVERVDVDVARGRAVIETIGPAPSTAALDEAITEDGYVVRGANSGGPARADKPRLADVIGAVVTVLALGLIGSKFGWFDGVGGTSQVNGLGTAIVLGLVAGSSSCLAVSGGLMLTMAAKYRESAPHAGMRPVLIFVFGRTLSYALLGALIGYVGTALTPAPGVTAALTLVAAAVMLVMGLDMLGIAPAWIKALVPRMPKRLAHRIADAGETGAAPFALGAATFFIPCGFTQALQIYALTAGPAQAAIILGGFALGTAPALLALGFASGSLKGRAGELFLRFSGALVLLLGIWNMKNGLTASGLVIPSFSDTAATVETAAGVTENGVQVVKLKITAQAPYYAPSNALTVKKGLPVRLEIDGIGMGCRSIFQIPKFGISVPLNKSKTVVEFTPKEAGQAAFSCSMGMYPGTITVI